MDRALVRVSRRTGSCAVEACGCGALAHIAADLFREIEYFAIGGKPELFAHQFFEDRAVANRTAAIARAGERAHQRDRDTRVERITRCAPSPPGHGFAECLTLFRVARERLQRAVQAVQKRGALVVDPALELRRCREAKAVEKGRDVQRYRSRSVTIAQCRVELVDVAPDDVAIET